VVVAEHQAGNSRRRRHVTCLCLEVDPVGITDLG